MHAERTWANPWHLSFCLLAIAHDVYEYYYEYEEGVPNESELPSLPADQPLSPIHLFDARQRRRREAKVPGQPQRDVTYKVCYW